MPLKKIHQEFLEKHGHKFSAEKVERFKQEAAESELKTNCDWNKQFKDGCNSENMLTAKCEGKCSNEYRNTNPSQ